MIYLDYAQLLASFFMHEEHNHSTCHTASNLQKYKIWIMFICWTCTSPTPPKYSYLPVFLICHAWLEILNAPKMSVRDFILQALCTILLKKKNIFVYVFQSKVQYGKTDGTVIKYVFLLKVWSVSTMQQQEHQILFTVYSHNDRNLYKL